MLQGVKEESVCVRFRGKECLKSSEVGRVVLPTGRTLAVYF